MTFENILLEKKNAIAYVTVNRPKVLNALNMATMEDLRGAFHDIKNDDAIRVVIVTGSGEKAFIAGADIGELSKNDAVMAKAYTHKGQSVLNLIENLGKPVIACINGFALGGGCEIAMACTMRLASDNAKFGQPEVKLGIIPRLWRHATPAAPGGQGNRHATGAGGRDDLGAGGASHRPCERGHSRR